MRLLSIEEPRALETAIATVRRGGVIAFPTDTVYGIGASLAFPGALRRIYAIKGRSATKPLPVLLSSSKLLPSVATEVDDAQLALLARFWPGPLTVALPARAELPPEVRAADGTVGLRIPNHSVALAIAERCGGALAVTSANPSGERAACTAAEIEAALGDAVDIILDGGLAPCGLPSTVLRFAGDTITIVRDGAIATYALLAAWDEIVGQRTAVGGGR